MPFKTSHTAIQELNLNNKSAGKHTNKPFRQTIQTLKKYKMNTITENITINGLDSEGRGVARNSEGKVYFLTNALPNEIVTEYIIRRNKKNYCEGDAVCINKKSHIRTSPICPHFGICGGCSLQHINHTAQVAIKQRILEDNLLHIGKIKPQRILPAIYGMDSAYRFRARMSVKYVEKKGGVLVGFHEKASPFVADMHQCIILPQHVSKLIDPLRQLIAKLSIKDKLPQIEWAVGAHLTVIAFRIMEALTEQDQQLLRDFIDQHQTNKNPIQLWLQPGKPDTLHPFYPLQMPALSYVLNEFNLELKYHPTEFTQVNAKVNEIMVSRAMQLLQPNNGENIIDMFCGLGNFSLPMARKGANVIGIEGAQSLVNRATQNAQHNDLSEKCKFKVANLFDPKQFDMQHWSQCDKWLIDPPRDGAFELVNALPNQQGPQRIVYVSCKSATLARDAQILQNKGYILRSAGIINMFAHTSHVESIALFEKKHDIHNKTMLE